MWNERRLNLPVASITLCCSNQVLNTKHTRQLPLSHQRLSFTLTMSPAPKFHNLILPQGILVPLVVVLLLDIVIGGQGTGLLRYPSETFTFFCSDSTDFYVTPSSIEKSTVVFAQLTGLSPDRQRFCVPLWRRPAQIEIREAGEKALFGAEQGWTNQRFVANACVISSGHWVWSDEEQALPRVLVALWGCSGGRLVRPGLDRRV